MPITNESHKRLEEEVAAPSLSIYRVDFVPFAKNGTEPAPTCSSRVGLTALALSPIYSLGSHCPAQCRERCTAASYARKQGN